MSVVKRPHAIRRALFPFLDLANARQAAFGATLAIFISYNACLILGFGLFGSLGNSIVTGALLFGLPLLLFLFSFRDNLRAQSPDFVFAGLLIAALLSSLINPRGNDASSTKKYLLLVAALAGYLACRPLLAEDVAVARSAFERITAAIVLVGAVFTAAEILNQWDGPTKPFVFGFNAAGTYFMMSLGFLVIALVTIDKPGPRRTAIISALIFLPAAIFAAAMVRFGFIALAGSLFVAMILADRGKRWHVAAVGFAILLAILVGLSARYDMAKTYAAFAVEQTAEIPASPPAEATASATTEAAAAATAATLASTPTEPNASVTAEPRASATEMPSCKLAVNMDNSIAIRQALAKDAIHLIPTAGLVGTGLDSFMKFSCIKAHEIHVSVLQAAVEFGWLGGIFWALLAGLAIYRLAPIARHSGTARFILCSLVFAILLSLAHGRISRDGALFALLGCAVGVSSPVALLRARPPPTTDS